MTHPREYSINQEPRERFLRYKTAHPLRPASVETPAEQELRWVWEEVGQLRATLKLHGIEINPEEIEK